MNGDAELGRSPEEEVGFLTNSKQPEVSDKPCTDSLGPLLTRDDLKRIETEEPVWRRARITLLALFWVVWIGLLVASVVLIVLSPKCPPRPTLNFWQSKVAYWVDPFAFADSNGDLIGDLKGLSNKVSYIKDVVGAGFVILSPFNTGQYSNEENELGLVANFTEIDPVLGTMLDFSAFIRTFHKNGLEVVLTFDFSTISASHPWTQQPSFLRRYLAGEVARDGSEAAIQINGTKYYSVGSNHTVNVDLMNTDVRTTIKKIIQYWLNQGVDGMVLSNAAFYAEGDGIPGPEINANSSNPWFSQYPSSQLFGDKGVDFVTFVRKVMDESVDKSGRSKLLAVDAGDVGYGLSDEDYSLRFLGSNGTKAAHLVIGRHFVKNRGWKTSLNSSLWQQPSLLLYDNTTGDQKSFIGLLTASASDQPQHDPVSLASILLLPGTPVLYYGSELAVNVTPILQSPKSFYPKGKVPFPNLTPRDSVLVCQLPMPWDRSGRGFSSALNVSDFNAHLETIGVSETVESVLSIGRSATPFQMVKELVALRQEPSLLWGKFEMLNPSKVINTEDVELFVRQAEGFPAFIVAFVKKVPNFGGVFDFSEVCDSITLRVVYPPHSELPLNKTVKSDRIFLRSKDQPTVYVFACS